MVVPSLRDVKLVESSHRDAVSTTRPTDVVTMPGECEEDL